MNKWRTNKKKKKTLGKIRSFSTLKSTNGRIDFFFFSRLCHNVSLTGFLSCFMKFNHQHFCPFFLTILTFSVVIYVFLVPADTVCFSRSCRYCLFFSWLETLSASFVILILAKECCSLFLWEQVLKVLGGGLCSRKNRGSQHLWGPRSQKPRVTSNAFQWCVLKACHSTAIATIIALHYQSYYHSTTLP